MFNPTPSLSSVTSADRARLIRLWTEAEKVAMHFNDLILNFRLKALGAVTVGAGLFGSIVLTREHLSTFTNYVLFACAMGFLALVWVGMWVIDFGYYSRLLRGAVREAIRLEQAIGSVRESSLPPETELIRLSRTIEQVVAGRKPDDEDTRQSSDPKLFAKLWARWVFYILPLVAFVAAAVIAIVFAVKTAQTGDPGRDSSLQAERAAYQWLVAHSAACDREWKACMDAQKTVDQCSAATLAAFNELKILRAEYRAACLKCGLAERCEANSWRTGPAPPRFGCE